jgi:acyl carrier protein
MSVAERTEQIEQVVSKSLVTFGADADAVNRDATFESLDVDSLDLAELAQIVEEEFSVQLTGNDVKDVATVGDLVDLIVSRL